MQGDRSNMGKFRQHKVLKVKLAEIKREYRKHLDHPVSDLYHWLLVINWWQFLVLFGFFYLGINVAFAIAYLTTNGGIANTDPESFSDAFFFSVQTLSTIGYGAMYPQTIYTQLLVTVEVLVGMLLAAMATGLMYARFAQPRARVLFSKVAVVHPFNEIPTLMFRVANQRDNRIIEARIQVSFLVNEVSPEGIELRRLYDLKLIRSESSSFAMSWLVMHPIDRDSPLWGKTPQELTRCEARILVILTGLDETFVSRIHARYTYNIKDLLWSARFADILHKSDRGNYYLDYARFHDTIPSS